METKFAHIIKEDFSFGLMHIAHPRCIKWYGRDIPGDQHDPHYIEWIDKATISEVSEIVLALELKEIELGNNGTKDFPLVNYSE